MSLLTTFRLRILCSVLDHLEQETTLTHEQQEEATRLLSKAQSVLARISTSVKNAGTDSQTEPTGVTEPVIAHVQGSDIANELLREQRQTWKQFGGQRGELTNGQNPDLPAVFTRGKR